MTTEAPVTNTTKSRDERGRWVKGVVQKAGPGRPRNEDSITYLLRSEVAKRPELVQQLCDKAAEDWRAMAWIIEHLEPQQKQDINVNVAVGVQLVWADGEQA